MLAACDLRNSRQLGPLAARRRPEPRLERAGGGRSSATHGSPACAAHRRSAGGPSAGSHAQTAAPALGSPATAAAARLGPTAVATSDAPTPDASATASAETPTVRTAAVAADERLRRPAMPGQPCRASAAQPAGAGSRARAATRAAQCPSRPDRAGYEQARRAEPERRDRGRRRPCRRSSQPSRSEATTPILAPFRVGRQPVATYPPWGWLLRALSSRESERERRGDCLA